MSFARRRRELEVERVGVALDGRQVDAVDLAVRRLVSLVLEQKKRIYE